MANADNSVSVEVPPRAFSTQTVLSISQFATPYPAPAGFTTASPQWAITASGTGPVQPVTISFQYDPTVLGNLDPSRVGVYLYNPGTGGWRWLAGQAGDNTVTVNTLSLGVFAVQANTQVFPDLDQAPWAQTAVDSLLGSGIVSGTGPDQFAPLQNVTRTQFAVMLARATGLSPAADGRTPFQDVDPTAWYAPWVSAAFNTNLMNGTGASTFSPDTPVTREEMAVMLARLPGSSSGTADASQFTDSAVIDSWALNAVEEVVGSGLMSGFPDGTFHPLGPTNRAQAAVVLYNYRALGGQT